MKIENDSLEIIVTLDFGPRIISFNLKGYENILFQDKEKKSLGEYLDVYNGDIIRLYGGHRLWISPEILPRCYYPDNHRVSYRTIANGIKFTAPVENQVNIQKSFSITFWGNNKIEIQHSIRNLNLWDIELSPWAITMMQPSGLAIMPITNKKTGFLPNRKLVFWDYANPSDKRLKVCKNFYSLKHIPGEENFKMGTCETKWASYLNKGQFFVKRFGSDFDAQYPDFGCNFEIYANEYFLELETLGPIQKIAPNEQIIHTETWEIHEEGASVSSEEDIANIIGKYIKE